MLAESIRVNTHDLRPLVQTVIESPEIASNVSDVLFEWEEYMTINDYGRPTPHRIPLSGAVTPSAEFVASCKRFLDRSGFQWRPEWLARLEAGSADAESCIFLLALPNLESLTLDFKNEDWDENYGTRPDDCAHVFRHEMLRSLIQDPKAFASATTAQYPLQKLEDFEMTQPYQNPGTIKGNYPSIEFSELRKVKGMFTLPNLQSVEMCQIGTSKGETFSEEEISSLSKSTQLEEIKLLRSSLSADDLSAIFGFAQGLKKVHIHLAWPEELFGRHGQDNVTPKMTSPKLLLEGLDQHRDTLEYLHINSINGQERWNSDVDHRFRGDEGPVAPDYNVCDDEQVAEHERRQLKACADIKAKYIQPIDLHEFTALRKVFVHQTDLLGPMNKDDPLDFVPLSSVLPPSVEILTLRYSNFFTDWEPQLWCLYERDVENALYGDSPWDVVGWDIKDNEAWYLSYYSHISDLLLSKPERFPELRQLTMCLGGGWPKPGEELILLAAEVGVNLILGDYVDEGDCLD